jgi:uncharacterized protein YcfJ
MKQTLLFTALGVAAFGAAAQEVGTVVSSTPVIQQVAVPRQFCNNQPVMVQPQTSGGGGLLGAIVGGVVGSTIGHGGGRMAATGVGAVVGAIAGNNIEANGYRQGQMVPTCTTETSYENRTVGYNVTYEYAGRQYTVQMPYDPGPTINLQVSPVGAASPGTQQFAAPVNAPPMQSSGVVVTSQPATVAYPAYPVYQSAYPAYPVAYPAYPYPAYPVYRPYPPIGVSLGFVFGGGRHRHWR